MRIAESFCQQFGACYENPTQRNCVRGFAWFRVLRGVNNDVAKRTRFVLVKHGHPGRTSEARFHLSLPNRFQALLAIIFTVLVLIAWETVFLINCENSRFRSLQWCRNSSRNFWRCSKLGFASVHSSIGNWGFDLAKKVWESMHDFSNCKINITYIVYMNFFLG